MSSTNNKLTALMSWAKNSKHLLWLVPLLLLGGGIFTFKAIYWGTPMLQFVPWWEQAVDMLRAGELPLWNTEVGMGAPLFANYQSALLYPPTWLYLIGGLIGGVGVIAWLMAVLIVFHLAVAGYGMAAVLKRLGAGTWAQVFGGLAFGMSTYLVSRSQFLSINAAAAWLPWALAFGYDLVQSRKINWAFPKLIGVLTLQLLSGHAQTAWYTLLLASAWVLFWGWRNGGLRMAAASLFKLAMAYLVAALIASPQLWATLEYMLNSQRATEVGLENALSYSFNPWQILTLLMPNLFGNPAHGNYWGYANFWEEAVYIGLPAAVCGLLWLFSLRRKENRPLKLALILGGLLTVILAFGRFSAVFPWLYEHVPTFSLFQAPARMNIWLVFALALAAGLGFERWHASEGKALYWSRLAVAGGVGILLVGLFGGAILPTEIKELPLGKTFFPSVIQLGLMIILLSVLNLLAPKEGETRAWWRPLVVGFLALDLLIANAGLLPFTDIFLYTDIEDMAIDPSTRIYIPADLQEELKFEQFFSFETFEIPAGLENIGPSLLPNLFSLADQPSANNFDPFVPANYAAWINRIENWIDTPIIEKQEWLSIMGVGYVADSLSASGEVIEWTKVESDIIPAEFRFYSPDGCRQIVGQDFVESKIDDIKIVEHRSNKVILNISIPQGGLLWQSQIKYPGWKVKLNSEPVEFLDCGLRVIQLYSGENIVEIYYQPIWLLWGPVLSIFGMGIAGFTVFKAGKEDDYDQSEQMAK